MYLLLCISFSVNSQVVITGSVRSANDHQIEYVNIGILGKSIGTVTDKDGYFSIRIPESQIDDTLMIRHINYETKCIIIRNLSKNKTNEIVLTDKENRLSEVIVLSRQIKKKWIHKGFKIPGSAEPNLLGEEFGITIKTSKFSGITKCKFDVTSCEYDSVVFRFNISQMDKMTPYYSKYITVIKDAQKRTYEIPLSIPLEQQKEIFVSLEYVYSYGKGGIKLPIYLGKAYSRKTSLDTFIELPVRIGFSIEAIN